MSSDSTDPYSCRAQARQAADDQDLQILREGGDADGAHLIIGGPSSTARLEFFPGRILVELPEGYSYNFFYTDTSDAREGIPDLVRAIAMALQGRTTHGRRRGGPLWLQRRRFIAVDVPGSPDSPYVFVK